MRTAVPRLIVRVSLTVIMSKHYPHEKQKSAFLFPHRLQKGSSKRQVMGPHEHVPVLMFFEYERDG